MPVAEFIDAWLKVYPNDRAAARRFVDGIEPHLSEAGIGSIREVFDARRRSLRAAASRRLGVLRKCCAVL
jgi:glycogen debranching enzyme